MKIAEYALNEVSTWVDITEPTMQELEEFNELHNLNLHFLRDCLEPDHLPKYEEDEGMAFFILRALLKEEAPATIQAMSSKIAVFFNEKRLITVHRLPHDFIDALRDKYVSQGRVGSTAELAVRIVRGVLNTYRDFNHSLSNPMAHVEDLVFVGGKPEPSVFGTDWASVNKNSQVIEIIYHLRKRVGVAERLCELTDDVLLQLHENEIVRGGQEHRDVMDYRLKLQNQLNESGENLQQLLQVYLSLSSQRTNDVMRVLTVFSVLFMPLTFIVGVYGMNFENMPELSWSHGYLAVWIAMIVVVVLLFVWFRRRNWL